MSLATLMICNAFGKMNKSIETVGETLGVSRIRLIKDVFLPRSIPTLVEMFNYFFLNSMVTISAVAFLATSQTKPLALMINQFEAQMQLENAAIVSVLILVVNLILKIATYLFKRLHHKHFEVWAH